MGATQWISVVVAPTHPGDYFASVGLTSGTPGDSLVLTDGTGWMAPAFSISNGQGAAPWDPVNTGISHTIIIPVSALITIDGEGIDPGDYLGVFHDSAGVLVCAGMERWTGLENLALSAFGDDPTTPAKDGFVAGEAFRWRVFRGTTGTSVRAHATYAPPSGIVTNTGTYAANGISKISTLAGPGIEQCLTLRQGWSLISLNVVPPKYQLDSLFGDLVHDLVILKNSQQKVFIPSVPVNTIGLWQPVEGYQVKFANARTLCISGDPVDPTQFTLSLPQGWSYIPYLRETETPIASLLSTLIADVIIVKDQDGRAYVPAAGLNAIGNMKPGQAYQIKMSSGRNLTYPSSIVAPNGPVADGVSRSVAKVTAAPWTFTNTGTSHTVIVPLAAISPAYGLPLVAGDLVGFFYDSLGTDACAGYDTWTGTGPIGVAVFGDDPTTTVKDGYLSGEPLKTKVWLTHQSKSYTPQASFLGAGALGGVVTDSTMFVPNGISGVSALHGTIFTDVGETRAPGAFALRQNFPNPFNPTTMVPYVLGRATHVRLSVISPLGQEMRVLVDQYQEAGEYHISFDAGGLASGMYFYRLRAGEYTETRRMMLVR